jgi:hypothetical protein
MVVASIVGLNIGYLRNPQAAANVARFKAPHAFRWNVVKKEGDLIGAIGYGPTVSEMYHSRGMGVAAIVSELGKDPKFMEVAEAAGIRALRPTDIHNSLLAMERAAKALVPTDSKAIGTLAMRDFAQRVGEVNEVCDMLLDNIRRADAILKQDLDDYEVEREAAAQYNASLGPNDKVRPLPQFPHAMYSTHRKSIATLGALIMSIRDDSQLKAVVRANTVNIRKGVDQDEMFNILFAVGDALGHPRNAVVAAFTEAMERTRGGKVVDVEGRPTAADHGMELPGDKAFGEPSA